MPPTGRDASQCDYIRTREIAILWDARESLTVVRRAANKETTSRRTGFVKFVTLLPATLTTSKVC